MFFYVCIYICIYDKRQREIKIEKTNEQKKKEYKRKKMKMRPSSGHGGIDRKKIRLLYVCLYACD